MEKDFLRNRSTTNSLRERPGDDAGLPRSISDPARQSTSSDFILQWGNRKRLRCMKVQIRDGSSGPVHRTTVRVDRRVVRAEKDSSNKPTTTTTTNHNNNGQISGYFNLRQRPVSPQAQAQPPQRILRNSENSGAMRGHSSRGFASPDRGAHDKRGGHNNNTNHHNHDSSSNNNNRSAGSSETAHDSKKGGSSSGSGEAAAPPLVWPPKFVIALSNKEKEEDFLVLKGSKLPQRPKKRAKFIQRTLNSVSPGAWLCDLTLDRYEVREKKVSKKRPRGLKAMTNNMESDSE